MSNVTFGAERTTSGHPPGRRPSTGCLVLLLRSSTKGKIRRNGQLLVLFAILVVVCVHLQQHTSFLRIPIYDTIDLYHDINNTTTNTSHTYTSNRVQVVQPSTSSLTTSRSSPTAAANPSRIVVVSKELLESGQQFFVFKLYCIS